MKALEIAGERQVRAEVVNALVGVPVAAGELLRVWGMRISPE